MKKIFSALCATLIILGTSFAAFAAPPVSAASVPAQTQQEKPLYFSDRKIETAAYTYGQLTYEMPKAWKQDKPDSGVRFSDGTHSASILVYSLEKALSGRKSAYARLERAIDEALINNPAFQDAEVLSKTDPSFLSSYASMYEISLKQNGAKITCRAAAFTSPDLKSYAVVYMTMADSASAEIPSSEYYEMLLNSIQWAPAGTQKPQETPRTQTSRAAQKEQTAPKTQDVSQNETVYWTPGGEVYHKTENCVSLKRSRTIKEGSVNDAKNAGKSRPCKLCAR